MRPDLCQQALHGCLEECIPGNAGGAGESVQSGEIVRGEREVGFLAHCGLPDYQHSRKVPSKIYLFTVDFLISLGRIDGRGIIQTMFTAALVIWSLWWAASFGTSLGTGKTTIRLATNWWKCSVWLAGFSGLLFLKSLAAAHEERAHVGVADTMLLLGVVLALSTITLSVTVGVGLLVGLAAKRLRKQQTDPQVVQPDAATLEASRHTARVGVRLPPDLHR